MARLPLLSTGYVLAVILTALVLPRPAGAESALPDPARWNNAGLIRVFEPNGGKLLSGIYRRGGLDNGASEAVIANDMLLPNANTVSRMEATVTLLDAQLSGTGFPANPRASLEGFFYWNGTGSGSSSDQVGHVLASVYLGINRDTGQLEARYLVIRCLDSACNTNTSLADAAVTPVDVFESHRLSIEYDGTRFTFRVDGLAPVTFVAPDSTRRSPTVPFKSLRTRIRVPPSAAATASVLALFDDLSVNGVPYESFDVPALPRVIIMPGSGTFTARQVSDVDIIVPTGDFVILGTRVTFDGADVSSLVSALPAGSVPGGGTVRRLRGFPVGNLPPGPHLLGVEATLSGNRSVRGFALWNILGGSEP